MNRLSWFHCMSSCCSRHFCCFYVMDLFVIVVNVYSWLESKHVCILLWECDLIIMDTCVFVTDWRTQFLFLAVQTEFQCFIYKCFCLSDTSVLALITAEVPTVIEYKSLTMTAVSRINILFQLTEIIIIWCMYVMCQQKSQDSLR